MKRIIFISILALLLTMTQGAWADVTISSSSDWNTFTTNVSNGTDYSGQTVKLAANITVTTMAGTSTNPFRGTFDGQGNTLTVTLNAQDNVAPFSCINGATIQNLKVSGSVTASRWFAAGIVGRLQGTSIVRNCLSDAAIISTHSYNTSSAGLIGRANGNLTISGCAFTGTINYTNNADHGGGIIGQIQDAATTITVANCVFSPTNITGVSSFYMFAGGNDATNIAKATIENCYYNNIAAGASGITLQGKEIRRISAGTDVTSLGISGASTEYNVSGITAYATGIKYNDVYYAGNGDEVSLALSHADAAEGYTFNEYTATAGTLSGTTLTMPDANVTINATWTENTATLTDGNDLSALSAWAGKTCTVTYTRSFTAGKPSTVCLPFAYTPQGEEKFYSFTGINEDGGNYTADMTEVVSPLVANTPYLFMPTGDANFSGTYAIPASIEAGTTTSGDWTFKGTYSTIEWASAPSEPTYGFSAQDANDGITQGQFVKVGSYVRIKPMRAYMQYNGSDSQFTNARSLTRAAATTSDDTLPETIGVRLISANGEVNAIGTLYTRTGEVSFDSEAWYTLDGKRLNAKPNTKGIYVNNGKKVVIK